MYNAFDPYLNASTWHTNHDLDEERFLRALGQVVRKPGFNADQMAEYMLTAKGLDRDCEDDQPLVAVIERRAVQAWAVYEFLRLGL